MLIKGSGFAVVNNGDYLMEEVLNFTVTVVVILAFVGITLHLFGRWLVASLLELWCSGTDDDDDDFTGGGNVVTP